MRLKALGIRRGGRAYSGQAHSGIGGEVVDVLVHDPEHSRKKSSQSIARTKDELRDRRSDPLPHL